MKIEIIKRVLETIKISPKDFEITTDELDLLNNIQNDLFDKLNDFKIVFISDDEKILRDYIIIKRLLYIQEKRELTVNEFISIYTKIFKVYK